MAFLSGRRIDNQLSKLCVRFHHHAVSRILVFNETPTYAVNQLNVREDVVELQFGEGLPTPVGPVYRRHHAVFLVGTRTSSQFPNTWRAGTVITASDAFASGAEVYTKIGVDTDAHRHIPLTRIFDSNPHRQHGIFKCIGNLNSKREGILTTDIWKISRIE